MMDFKVVHVRGKVETVGVRYVFPCRSCGCDRCLILDCENLDQAVHKTRWMGWKVRGVRAMCSDCLAQEGRVSDSLCAFWRASDGLPPEIDLARNPYSCSHMTDRLYCTMFDASMRCCHDACYSCEHFDGEREER